VHYATTDGSATNKLDYVGDIGNVKFKRGATSATITIRVRSDKVSDPTEVFFIDLSDANGAAISHGHAVGWIVGG
jgi:hypothetical protein